MRKGPRTLIARSCRRYGQCGLPQPPVVPMPHADARPMTIRLSPSRQLMLALTMLHLGALVCAFASDVAAIVQWPLALWVVMAAYRHIALHAIARSTRSIVVIAWDGRDRWRLVQRDGRVLDAVLERGAYAHPALMALPFRTRHGRRLRVLIVPDMVDAKSLRRLRAGLRCARSGPIVA